MDRSWRFFIFLSPSADLGRGEGRDPLIKKSSRSVPLHFKLIWWLKIVAFGLKKPPIWGQGASNERADWYGVLNIFFIFLKDLFYKLCLGCNIGQFLMIFLWKLIKNSYSAIKNLKKLWLQAKFSNFWMPLVPIKNILPFSHNKWDKHLISSKKYLSRVPMFVSQNGMLFDIFEHYIRKGWGKYVK